MSTTRYPEPEECVLRYAIERHARERPNERFITFLGGEEWTFAETLDQARRAAMGLQALGVKQGDNVFSWLPNGPDLVRTWLGANYLGAVYVPANLAYTGNLLQHVLNLSDAKVAVIHADLVGRLKGLDLGGLTDAVIVGGAGEAIDGLVLHPASQLRMDGDPGETPEPIKPWDSIYVIFTSGTTGPSKAVLCSYSHIWFFYAYTWPAIYGPGHRFLLSLPLFHAGGTGSLYVQLIHGGSLVVVESFKTDQFWNVIRDNEVTTTCLLGAMTPFLLGRPPSDEDRTHPLKAVISTPYTAQAREFTQRFGVDAFSSYSMSELSCPIVSEANPAKLGVSGKVRPGFEVRIVDENDFEVPVGVTGEALVRCNLPWMMLTEYYKNPVATAEAWRNGWFHTGDGLKVDEDGDYFFVERIKDAIRRRGENISAYEVEQEVQSHPAVQEAAAVAVHSEQSEDEVLVCVIARQGHTIDPKQLLEYLIPRMPHYMVPRYLRIMDAFPRTPSQKVQKYVLRDDGVTADTWDRESAGIVVRRQKIGA